MQTDVNKEGLTFKEWVCAAAVAVIDQGMVKPYTTSYTYYKEHEPEYYLDAPGRCFTDRRPKRRRTTTWYSKQYRNAWKNGEDPTEYRA